MLLIWGVGCEDKVGMVFSFGVRGLSGDRCNTGHGDRAGADLIYIVSVVSLSLHRLTNCCFFYITVCTT